jgi:hypothetical protein
MWHGAEARVALAEVLGVPTEGIEVRGGETVASWLTFTSDAPPLGGRPFHL